MNTSSSIFISGATGFVGSYIVRLLFEKGYRNIIGLRRKTSRLDLLGKWSNEVQWVEGDLFELDILDQAMKSADIVIHTAALVSFHKGDFKELMHINVQGTANLVNLALKNGIEHFHFISSVAALGRILDQPIVSESSYFQNTSLDTGYGLSKHLAEMEVWRGEAEGLTVSIINPTLVLGAGYWDSGSPAYFTTAARGIKFYPLGATGFVDVRDVARMSIQILEEDHSSEKFICNGWDGSHKDLLSMISTRTGVKPPTKEVSKLIASIAWRAEYLRSKILGRRPIITEETLRVSRQRFGFANDKSKRILGFEYIPIEETISEMAELYMKSKKAGKDFAFWDWNL